MRELTRSNLVSKRTRSKTGNFCHTAVTDIRMERSRKQQQGNTHRTNTTHTRTRTTRTHTRQPGPAEAGTHICRQVRKETRGTRNRPPVNQDYGSKNTARSSPARPGQAERGPEVKNVNGGLSWRCGRVDKLPRWKHRVTTS